jgi:ABC-type uncharacterized transport system substrate-binding protein
MSSRRRTQCADRLPLGRRRYRKNSETHGELADACGNGGISKHGRSCHGSAKDIVPAFETLKGGADALYVCVDPLLNAHRISINTLANVARLPTITGAREFVEAGSLMSYGANFPDLFRRAADYVDKILRGVKPTDLPVEQPTKFNFTVNLTNAKALGLEIPPTLLDRADEVIE